MYSDLAELNRKPRPFSRYTTDVLWTDPWIAQKMLKMHLDDSTDLASRKSPTIDGTVAWIDRKIGLSGKNVCDLGCGPGLYARRMATRGAKVIGVDFSAGSLDHARAEAAAHKLDIEYRKADYLIDDLPDGQDVVSLIWCDFCTLSPQKRRALLERIKAMLNPGGTFVFDVSTTPQFEERAEVMTYGRRPMGDFWSPDDHFGFQTTFLYERDKIALDRYLIVTPKRQLEIFNWMQYFDPETISRDVREAGMVVAALLDVRTGDPWTPEAGELAVVARV
ncbi:methyltransferase domain-containing protein [Roseobacter sp. HKCCD8659]|uniref:class I SAM-dependent methyltransferase n=4 Tax=unclassified Roseobacter TaxID=196798 RepID=UPI00149306F5|nr:methyltransferase domain-containing protein [Roseobacter sp. HKCCD7357]NNX93722.1 methyltransferase domain-containing protein [Roseobacter sp. HKCCD9042]NOC79986.1 methyltransferase domain-containing protein [Roseobacter sp. HKCCD8430]NOC97099.1 methyltransferase domain-containing protein [Roseobacter sp. HKCCD8659]